ncbi:DNA-binding response regulator [Lactococcus insecticola]|uniref:DNA-binding response regulator n=2 Tax=Pseudolactococcus insecticola TaxID=2709158 RepID=A0A6A0B8V3_9LACT|nr:DNA-binding response regulator [Lactococcus insecticola]
MEIMLVDDHVVLREGLRATLIRLDESIKIVHEASNGQEALDWLADNNAVPDIILLDVKMPVLDGVETMKKLAADYPSISVVVLTTFDETQTVKEMVQLGAKSYLLKDAEPSQIYQTLKRVSNGEVVLSDKVVNQIFSTPTEPTVNLTPREQQVLQMLAEGYRNKEIAAELYLSERTIRAELTSIYNQLGVESRSEAVSLALRQNLVK